MGVASFGSTIQNLALTWLPVMFFLLMCFVAYLLWRAVEEDPLRRPRSQRLEALGVAQELDHLAQLLLGLVEARDLVPRDRRRRARRNLHRLDPGHDLHGPPQQVRDEAHQQEEHDRQPCEREVLESRRKRSQAHVPVIGTWG